MSNILLDDGQYDGKIVHVEWKESQYQKASNNPSGECLNLWIDVEQDDNVKRLFVDIGIHKKDILSKVMDSVGVDEAKQLKGKMIRVHVVQYTSKVGKVSNIIKDYEKAGSKTKKVSKKGSVQF